MSWKKNLGILACFVGTAVGTMHVINRVFTHIATAYNYLDGNDLKYYDWSVRPNRKRPNGYLDVNDLKSEDGHNHNCESAS